MEYRRNLVISWLSGVVLRITTSGRVKTGDNQDIVLLIDVEGSVVLSDEKVYKFGQTTISIPIRIHKSI